MKLLTIKPKGILRKVILPCMYTIILHCNTNIIKIIGFTKFFFKRKKKKKTLPRMKTNKQVVSIS